MFETDQNEEGIPCDHPITFFERALSWLHERCVGPDIDRERWHPNIPSMCNAFDRVVLHYPCRACETNREVEFGALFPDDKAVLKRWGREEWDEGWGPDEEEQEDEDAERNYCCPGFMLNGECEHQDKRYSA